MHKLCCSVLPAASVMCGPGTGNCWQRTKNCSPSLAIEESNGGQCAGLAVSRDGITWQRDLGQSGKAGESAPALPPGVALGPNQDNWWWHDTKALSVGDVQVSPCIANTNLILSKAQTGKPGRDDAFQCASIHDESC